MDKKYIKSLEIYVNECESLVEENEATVMYLDKMCMIYSKRKALILEQQQVTNEQIDDALKLIEAEKLKV